MENRELKKFLAKNLQLQDELIELLEQCMEEIFPDEKEYAKHVLNEDIENGMSWNGCLQPLEVMRKKMKPKDKSELTNG